jgi:hypothetical protein
MAQQGSPSWPQPPLPPSPPPPVVPPVVVLVPLLLEQPRTSNKQSVRM